MRRLLCRFAGHRRSASRAWPTTDGWKSYCRRCRAKLIRVAPEVWEEDLGPKLPESGGYVVFRPSREIIAYPSDTRMKFPAELESADD